MYSIIYKSKFGIPRPGPFSENGKSFVLRPAWQRLSSSHMMDIASLRTSPQPTFRTAQGVGKSCLIHRYVKGHFDKDSKITIGAAFLSHTVNLRDEGTVKPVKFEIWDTAGTCAGGRGVWMVLEAASTMVQAV